MPNMSYCRFENTVRDLKDCWDNWDEELKSESEKKAKDRLIKICREITENES